MNPKSLAAIIKASIERNTQYIEPRIKAISIIAAVCFPLYYVIWHYVFPQPYENLGLRLLGCALFIPSIFVKHWTGWMNRYKSIYWYAATLYTLPFFFIFMLLKNDGSQVWLAATLIAIFLMLLWLDWLNICIQLVLGALLAWASYYLTTDSPHVTFHTLEYVPIYVFAIVVGIVTNYSAERLRHERLRAMLAATSNIAHELRTPLLGIKSGAVGLQQYLPPLLDAYQKAREQNLAVTPIRAVHLQSMHGVLDRIKDEVDYSNTVIDMLLMNTRPSGVNPENLTDCSIAECVRTAIERYPFSSERERQLVTWHAKEDFRFRGVELLTVHVLFNLIKNALYHIAKAGKGAITISLASTPQGNVLVFRDTGAGIPPRVLPHIFTRFYSWSADGGRGLGAGIGLAFCRGVMESLGGSIRCISQEGAYTEFVLTFPSISDAHP